MALRNASNVAKETNQTQTSEIKPTARSYRMSNPIKYEEGTEGSANWDDEATVLLDKGGKPPKAISSWVRTSTIICANLMGAGVLALPIVLKHLGWIPALTLIVVFGAGAVYSGYLMHRVWNLADHAVKYGDLGQVAYGHRGHVIVNFVTYFYIAVVTVVFHLTSAESLQTVFYDVGGALCQWHYSFIVALLVIPLAQIHSLQNVSLLAFIGSVTILGTVGIVAIRLLVLGKVPGSHTTLINTSTHDIPQKASTVMTIVFSYCGQAIFTELISSMQTPSDFPKAVWSSTLIMGVAYFMIAVIGYMMLGDLTIAPVTSALPEDIWAQFASILLFVHVIIAYVIELNILTKGSMEFFFGLDTAKRRNLPPVEKRSLWAIASCLIIFAAFFLSNLCSFFTELLSFAGATGGIATTYIFPCLFLLKLDKKISSTEAAICKILIGFAIVLSVVGTANTIWGMIDQWESIGPPFMCMSCEYKRKHKLTPGVC